MARNATKSDGVILSRTAFEKTKLAVNRLLSPSNAEINISQKQVRKERVAKITEEVGGGFYKAIQVLQNPDGSIVDLPVEIALIWDGNIQAGNLQEVQEFNLLEGIEVDTIIRILTNYLSPGKYVPVFESGASSLQVQYSITKNGNKAQFVNDKPIGGLGGNSINVYAGNDAGTGKGRGWKPGWEESDILNSVINPQEDGNDPNRGGMNQRHIRVKNNNNKQTVAFRHANLPESDLASKIINTLWGVSQATYDSLSSLDNITKADLTAFDIDNLRHILERGLSYVEDPYDPYEPTSGVKIQSLSGLSSSGTFFDDNLSQESQTLDDQGNNTAIYNTLGGLATSTNFVMSAMNTEGQLLEISIVQAGFNAVGNAILKNISQYDPAPKNGNNDSIRLNLARFAFNTQIIFTVSLLDFPDKSDTIAIAGHNGMSSTTEFVNLPEDGIQTDVKVNLLQNGINITRFDNLGEYRLKFTFTYKSDGSAVDVGGDPGTENILYIADTEAASWSGGEVIVSYTPTIPDLRLNDIIEVCPVLEWYQNANANPAQLGDTNFPMVCAESAIAGNPYEITLAVDGVGNVVDTFSPEINNTTGVFSEPIPWEFEILKNAAPTTDYSNAGAKVRIYMYKLGDSAPLVGWGDEFLTETTLAQPYIEYTIDASGGQTNNTDGQVGFINKIQLEDYTTTTQYYLRYEVIE